jgi:putative aminopeptidase FrvX
VYDYLLSFAHEIISFKMMDRLVEYWNSNKIEWHLDRGLKVNTDGSALHNPQARGVTSTLLSSMNKYQR